MMRKEKIMSLVAAGVLTVGSAVGFAGCGPKAPQGDLGRETTLYVQLINYTVQGGIFAPLLMRSGKLKQHKRS